MNKSIFKIEQMDCPSEENLIRMKLQNIEGVAKQEFDLKGRIFTVYHTGDYQEIEKQLATLNLGSRFIESKEVTGEVQAEENSKQRKVLWIVLAINFGFFLIEMSTGIISKSMGLVADSLDMLADAFVYGLSLFAVGAAVSRKKRVAMICGYFQILFGCHWFYRGNQTVYRCRGNACFSNNDRYIYTCFDSQCYMFAFASKDKKQRCPYSGKHYFFIQ